MTLLNDINRVFITETAWLALLDTKNSSHKAIQKKFKEILDKNYKVITSSYVVDTVLETLKKEKKTQAYFFLSIIEKAILSGDLKVFWLNRRLRNKAIKAYIESDAQKLTLIFNVELIKSKKIQAVLTLTPHLYMPFSLSCHYVLENKKAK